jgi:transcriptional regulator with XRE-family HTH domain
MKSGGLNASEFADKIGVKRSNLSHVLSGRNKPSLDFLIKVIEAYPKVNASWLITGETRVEETNEETAIHTSKPMPHMEKLKGDSRVERIVFFYEDGSYREYRPNSK